MLLVTFDLFGAPCGSLSRKSPRKLSLTDLWVQFLPTQCRNTTYNEPL